MDQYASSAFGEDLGSPAKQIGVDLFVNENTRQVKGLLPMFETASPTTEELLADLAMSSSYVAQDAQIELECGLQPKEAETESILALEQWPDDQQVAAIDRETITVLSNEPKSVETKMDMLAQSVAISQAQVSPEQTKGKTKKQRKTEAANKNAKLLMFSKIETDSKLIPFPFRSKSSKRSRREPSY
jgi:hypothetical protein